MYNLFYYIVLLIYSIYVFINIIAYSIYEIKEQNNKSGAIAIIAFSAFVIILCNIFVLIN